MESLSFATLHLLQAQTQFVNVDKPPLTLATLFSICVDNILNFNEKNLKLFQKNYHFRRFSGTILTSKLLS